MIVSLPAAGIAGRWISGIARNGQVTDYADMLTSGCGSFVNSMTAVLTALTRYMPPQTDQSYVKTVQNIVKYQAIAGLLSLLIASSAYAHDSDRIDQLQKEVEALKLRLTELESLMTGADRGPAAIPSAEGWKSVQSWRLLSQGMTPPDVQRILGKPHRVEVGFYFTVWYYRNGGTASFVDGGLAKWREPGQ